MFGRQYLSVVLLLFCVLPICAAHAANKAALTDCYDKSNPVAARFCQAGVLATYQAIQVVQVKHGMKQPTCQFGVSVSAERLVDNLHEDAVLLAAKIANTPIAAATIAFLSAPAHCNLGVANEVGGLRTGALFKSCSDGLKPGAEPDVCFGYVAALRDSFAALSGFEGNEDFYCPPEVNGKGPDVKSVLKLLIAETKLEVKKQESRPAAEVMAEALSRAYPCHR